MWRFTISSIALLLLVSSSGLASNSSGRSDAMRSIFEMYNRGNHNKCGFHILANYFGSPGADPAVMAILQFRPVNDTSIVSPSGLFRIHFDTSGINAPVLYASDGQPEPNSAFDFADTVAAICDHVYHVEVDSLGFPPPASDSGAGGGDEYDIYIESLPTGEYGYTDWDSYHPIINRVNPTFATWTVIRNEFESTYTKGVPAMEVTIAHEFNHGIQLGNYGLWQRDLWFYELTSTWMEQVVYPGVKDYYQYLSDFFGSLNRQPFNAYEPGNFAGYERCVFGIFVQNAYGSQLMKAIWQNMSRERPLAAIEDAFSGAGILPSAAFQLFSEWNYFTGDRALLGPQFGVVSYPLAQSYPSSVIEGTGSLSGSGVTFSGSSLPLTEHFFQVSAGPDTIGLVAANNDFAAASVSDTASTGFSVGITDGGPYCVRQLSGGYCVFFDVSDYQKWSLLPFISGEALIAQDNLVFPQPFDPAMQQVKIPYPYRDMSGASLYIYDISGLLVDKMTGDQNMVQYLRGTYFVWDGRNSLGKKVGTGVYLYVVTDGSHSTQGKIAVVRNR